MIRRVNVNGNGVALLSRAIRLGGGGASSATNQRFLQAALYGTTAYSNANSNPHWLSSRGLADRFGPIAPSSVPNGVVGTRFINSLAKEPPRAEKFSPKDVVLFQYEAALSAQSQSIIDKLFQRIHPDSPAVDGDEEKKWRGWVDNHLVHVLSPNIYRTASEALESFDYITTPGNFSFTERIIAKYTGAAAMYFVSKKLKKRHNITDERAALYEAAETWVYALKGRRFLGGLNPNLADLAVFGVLRPIRHLKSGRDMVEHTHIGDWYTRMESAVGESSRIKAEK
ncbi:hypothetical protein SLA2020_285450 [Shorea laevis]